jgi:hypothetical protein
MFSTFGPDTLKELRQTFGKLDGHVHVNRFLDMHDIGDPFGAASRPVMDAETITDLCRRRRPDARPARQRTGLPEAVRAAHCTAAALGAHVKHWPASREAACRSRPRWSAAMPGGRRRARVPTVVPS